MTGTKDAGTTGNFEVTVNGTLVHSKKAGKGVASKQEEVDAISAAIEIALKK
jgi:selT/selW/selH-like putative selenoprotein